MSDNSDIGDQTSTQYLLQGQEDMISEEYSVTTNNFFAPLCENRRVGNQDINPQGETNESNPAKRKRINTGSVDFCSFENMSTDEKLSMIYAKLSNIEEAQEETMPVQSRMNSTTDRLQRTVCHVDVNTYRSQLLAYKYLDLETRFREKNVIIHGLQER